jgi:hydroxymethylbilane synthase
LAEVVDGDTGPELSVRAVVAAVDGSVSLRRSLTGPVDDPEALGDALAAVLAEDGAAQLVPPRLRTSIDPAEPPPASVPSTAGRFDTSSTTSATREGDQ